MSHLAGFVRGRTTGLVLVFILAPLMTAPPRAGGGEPSSPAPGSQFRLDAPSVVADGSGGLNGQSGVAVADLDNDGRPEILAGSYVNGSVRVFWAGEDGQFTPEEYPCAIPSVGIVTAADFTGDMLDDIVAVDSWGMTVVLLVNNGSGFNTAQTIFQESGDWAGIWGIAACDMNHDSKWDLAFTVRNPNVGYAGIMQILLGDGLGGFSSGSIVSVWPFPRRLITAQLTSDTNPDVVVASQGDGGNGWPDGKLTIWLGNGDGTVQAPLPYDSGKGTFATAARDIDLDGKVDIVATNSGDGTLVVYRNLDNAGTFALVATLPLLPPLEFNSTGFSGVVIGDFTGTGKMSIAVSNVWATYATGISLFEGTSTSGNISFAPRTDVATTWDTMQAISVYPADGHEKIVAVEDSKTAVIDLTKLGLNTDMSSSLPGLVGVGLAVVDLDGDGLLDQTSLAYAGGQTQAVVRLGQPDGSLGSKIETAVGTSGADLKIVDFDNDSTPDIAIAGANTRIYHGNGDGTFATTPFSVITGGGVRIEYGDFDNNGRKDVAILSTSNARVRISLQALDGTFSSPTTNYSTVSGPNDFALGDVTGDDIPDVVAPGEAGSMTLLQGNADGTFTPQTPVSVPSWAYSVRIGDIDGSGPMDVVIGTFMTIETMLSNGGGSFAPPTSVPSGGFSVGASVVYTHLQNGMVIADLDLDGHLDVAATVHYRNIFEVHLNNGDGTLGPARQYGVQAVYPEDIVVDSAIPPNLYILSTASQVVTKAVNLTPGPPVGVPAPGPDPGESPLMLPPPYPNPAHGASLIPFALSRAASVDITVYDVAGARVRTLLPEQELPAGQHEIRWDLRDDAGNHVAAGAYFVRAHADGEESVRTLMVVP